MKIKNENELELYMKIVEKNDTVDFKAIIDYIAHIADIGGIDCKTWE